MVHNAKDIQSPVPNDFNIEFFQSFLKVMKSEVLVLFDQFHQHECLPSYFTSYFTTHIPKANDSCPISSVAFSERNGTDAQRVTHWEHKKKYGQHIKMELEYCKLWDTTCRHYDQAFEKSKVLRIEGAYMNEKTSKHRLGGEVVNSWFRLVSC